MLKFTILVFKGVLALSTANNLWCPEELIINNKVKDHQEVQEIIEKCKELGLKEEMIKYVDNADNKIVTDASSLLKNANDTLRKINEGKKILFVSGVTSKTVGQFDASDKAIICPEFEKLVYASNGCFYKCDWCYLKLTYRTVFPFMTVSVPFDDIKKLIEKKLNTAIRPILFNSGEMADSLSLEHITGTVRKLIPYFAQSKNGYLYLLSKSDQVDIILNDPAVKEVIENKEGKYNKDHIIFAWSINNEDVSREFEIVAPLPSKRMEAAKKIQDAGFRIRLRLDPIVRVEGWEEKYKETINQMFDTYGLKPERITLGTLRFEPEFIERKNTYVQSDKLKNYMSGFEEMRYLGLPGKYSYPEKERYEIFSKIIGAIREKAPNIDISMCKESESLWQRFKDEANGSDKKRYDIENMKCVCILDKANGKYKPGVIYDIPISELHPDPDQPRKHFDEEDIKILAESIKDIGLQSPLFFTVNDDNKLVIVAGERRYRAVNKINEEIRASSTKKKNYIKTLPCLYTKDKQDIIALVENLHRENLSPVEEAIALQKLIKKYKYTQEYLEVLVGKKQNTISEILSINKLPEEILDECIKNKKVSRRFLVELAKFNDVEVIKKQFKKAKKYEYSSTILKDIRKKLQPDEETSTNETTRTPNYYSLARGSVKTLKSYFERLVEDEDEEEISGLYEEYEQLIPFVRRVFSSDQIENLILSLQEEGTETEETE